MPPNERDADAALERGDRAIQKHRLITGCHHAERSDKQQNTLDAVAKRIDARRGK